ncbi:hypothetical protein [Frigoribacterium sp. UYMn621]|uniref:hypothetical protein n=1 Tax=Frigoribacterium sp. UYMn621 TaxID=3156343 RepID=UPI003398C924
MTLSPEEIRHLAVSLLTAPTARDRQHRIGASDMANGCDFHLAEAIQGEPVQESDISKRTWMGAVLGTAGHSIFESRVAEHRNQFAALEGAETEKHLIFAELDGYGPVGGSIDLLLAPSRQLIDWKGSTRKKSAIMQDYLATAQGLEPQYGRSHKDIKLSEKVYAEEIAKMEYKVTGYFGQQTLYMHSGVADSAALVFFNRDGTGFFDVPELDRYFDAKAVHDIWVLPFEYDRDYALALIARAQEIYDRLQSGATLGDFARNPLCFPCSMVPAELTPADEVLAGVDFIIPPGKAFTADDAAFAEIVANFATTTTTDPTF